MTATISTLEPLSAWLRSLMFQALAPLASSHGRTVARPASRPAASSMESDPHRAGLRMRVGGGYCGTVELTGRYTINPHTGVRLYEDTEGRLHYLTNLRPVADGLH